MGRRSGASILGAAGGILGIFVGIFIYCLRTSGVDNMSAESAVALLVLLGILGFIGGAVVERSGSLGGALMLNSGILGYFIVLSSGSSLESS